VILALALAAQLGFMTEAPVVETIDPGASASERLLSWTPGRCTERYRVWRWGWKERAWQIYAETEETQQRIPVREPIADRWRVSAICPDGTEWITAGGEIWVFPGPWDAEVK